MKLTDVKVRQAKPRERPYKLGDGNGLHLEVLPTGGKYWHLRYWVQKKEHKVSLGVYPEVGLADARAKRDAFKKALAAGLDPRAKKTELPTFEGVAREWHSRNIVPSKSTKYSYQILSRLEKFIFPHIGGRPINEIAAPEILVPLRTIEALGLNDTAHTVHQIAGQIFRYAIANGYAERNPAADLIGALTPVVTQHRAAITDPRKIKDLITAMGAFSGSPVVKAALWFSAYTYQRPGEIRKAEWAEVDLDAGEWRIPAEKMKMREPHIVTLSKQSVGLLRKLRPLTGHGRYVFPSIRSATRGDVPMSENTIVAALRRLGFGQDEMCAHGFRGMASTILNEQEWNFDVIEASLAHSPKDGARSAYNHARWLSKRREMVQWWADWLDSLKG
jgi:integrase